MPAALPRVLGRSSSQARESRRWGRGNEPSGDLRAGDAAAEPAQPHSCRAVTPSPSQLMFNRAPGRMRWQDEDRKSTKKPEEGSGRRFGITSRAKKIRGKTALPCKDRLFPAVYAKEARSGIWTEARELPGSDRPSFLFHLSVRQAPFGAGKTPQCPRHGLRKNTPGKTPPGFQTIASYRPRI